MTKRWHYNTEIYKTHSIVGAVTDIDQNHPEWDVVAMRWDEDMKWTIVVYRTEWSKDEYWARVDQLIVNYDGFLSSSTLRHVRRLPAHEALDFMLKRSASPNGDAPEAP